MAAIPLATPSALIHLWPFQFCQLWQRWVSWKVQKGGKNGRRNRILKFPCKRSSSREPESWSGQKKVPRASLGPWPRSSVHENAHGSSPSSPLSPTDVQNLSTRTHVLIKVISEAETGSDPNGEINMQTTEWKSRCINSLFYSMLLQERQ